MRLNFQKIFPLSALQMVLSLATILVAVKQL